MPLPRLQTCLNFRSSDDTEEQAIVPRVLLPLIVVDMIVDWYKEFQRARVKAYHYKRFMKTYNLSLVKSNSRLKLYNRELKAMGMKFRTLGEHGSFQNFVVDSNRCKRKYDYVSLKGIFF